MTEKLIVHNAGPGVTVQDLGRPGYLAFGLSRGGAVDPLALYEGAALLGQAPECAALELAGMGGAFETTTDTRIALTGAPMKAMIDGVAAAWNASHTLKKGARITIGGTLSGSYGYLHVDGGITTPKVLNGRGTHLNAGLGAPVQPGNQLPLGPSKTDGPVGLALPMDPRFDGGTVRLVPSLQTSFFSDADIDRFQSTTFTRDTRGNRMGVRLLPPGDGFQSDAGLNVLSEVIVPGDVQITGDGTPFVLLCECQTTGGYPRIGSVLPADLPKVAQARPGTSLSFQFVSMEEAVAIDLRERDRRAGLRNAAKPLIRDPATMHDLLSYQLISGMIAGNEETPQ